jgi:aminopeptidase N
MTTVTRLITYFVPSNYRLALTLESTERRFSGSVTISGSLQPDADHVGLHAKDLNITSVSVDGQPARFHMGQDDELRIEQDGLSPGEHTVDVEFNGNITDSMHGIYPCYFEHEGTKKELLATQFESHHAREVFPCIDEPAAKATFDVTLTTETGVTALSNMPLRSQEINDDTLISTFDTTPRMSTYLLALVVGELHKKTAHTKDGVEVNVWATPAQSANSLDFALDIAVRSIEFYEDYFDTKYPLPKCDHVALPDFSSGAMENWGLITYRETALLADPKLTSIQDRHHIATVITHELAHQWFGNLVTMQWWNDLWLNESFANLMEYISVDALHPEWNIWLDYVTSESIMALRRDSIDGVQSVQVDVHHPDEISTLFDGAIVYAKGGRLLRMIQEYIGHDAFREGLKQYFSDHAYSNTVGDDLWEALEASSGKQIKSIMNTWISQPGYPVVSLQRDGDELTVSQTQFFVGPHSESNRKWPIPLGGNSSKLPELLTKSSITVAEPLPVQLNHHDSAHFITQYDALSRKALIDKVVDGSLDPIARVQLLDEATLLARGGVMRSDALLPLLTAYGNETLEPVWNIIALGLAELRKFVENDTEAESRLRALTANMAANEYNRLGWEVRPGETEEDTKLRSTIVALTLYGEVPDALAQAKDLYKSTAIEDLDTELRAIILSSVVRHGDGSVVDELMAAYKKTQSIDLRQDICVAVTSTKVPEKIKQLLDNMKDSEIVRPQDVFRWFVYLIRGKDSREYAWEWIRDNWDWIEKTFKGDKSYDDFPRYSASGLMTREQLEQYRDFFGPMISVPALSRTITMGISEIEGRVSLIERDQNAVKQALLDLATPIHS